MSLEGAVVAEDGLQVESLPPLQNDLEGRRVSFLEFANSCVVLFELGTYVLIMFRS